LGVRRREATENARFLAETRRRWKSYSPETQNPTPFTLPRSTLRCQTPAVSSEQQSNSEDTPMLDVTTATPQTHASLTVFPLIAAGPAELPFTLMTDAIEAGTLKITEVGSGTVPELLATNTAATAIL